MREYKIIFAKRNNIENEVKDYIVNGWMPQGGAFAIVDGSTVLIGQAVIREVEDIELVAASKEVQKTKGKGNKQDKGFFAGIINGKTNN